MINTKTIEGKINYIERALYKIGYVTFTNNKSKKKYYVIDLSINADNGSENKPRIIYIDNLDNPKSKYDRDAEEFFNKFTFNIHKQFNKDLVDKKQTYDKTNDYIIGSYYWIIPDFDNDIFDGLVTEDMKGLQPGQYNGQGLWGTTNCLFAMSVKSVGDLISIP